MKKAFVYLRVSGQSQIEGDGFERQLIAIKKHAAANDIKLMRVFREEGVSGTKDLENRPALQEMLLALMSNGVRCVLIEKLDRLARDLMVQESIIADFRKKGFEIISSYEPDICSDDPARKMIRQILGVFSEYEKSMIVTKLRGARQRKKARTGHCEGRKPYGHHAGEQAVLESMKAMRAQGLGVDVIASTLTAEGVLTRSGGQWYGATINKILKREGN